MLPVAANLLNGYSSSGLCGARRRARPTGAHRSRASNSNSSSRVIQEAWHQAAPSGSITAVRRSSASPSPDGAATAGPDSQMSGNVDRWVRGPLTDDA